MTNETKKHVHLQLKADGDRGAFRATFATFNVVDHDGDLTLPGAFEAGAPVIVGAWNHNHAALPVGKGVIGADSRVAWVDGRFFLDTAAGRDTYETVKALGDSGEWSYVFNVLKQSFGEHEGQRVRFLEKVKVFSVDPVLVAAGVGTRTTSIKCDSCAAKGPDLADEFLRFDALRTEQLLSKYKPAESGGYSPLKSREIASVSINPIVRAYAGWAASWTSAEKGVSPVDIHWFVPWEGGPIGAYHHQDRKQIWLSADLSPWEAVQVAAHEVAHCAAGALSPGRKVDSEAEAKAYERDVIRRLANEDVSELVRLWVIDNSTVPAA